MDLRLVKRYEDELKVPQNGSKWLTGLIFASGVVLGVLLLYATLMSIYVLG